MALDALALDTLALNTLASHEPAPDYVICPETPASHKRILELTDRAFGPGRFVKTAERLREDSAPIADLSFVAMQGERVLGSVRMWPVFVYDNDTNHYEPLVFLGPIVVDSAFRSQGIGKKLIAAAVEGAFRKGLRAVLLVGSQAYFTPFGFNKAHNMSMPGPVDPNRVLIRYCEDGLSFRGRVCKVI